MGAQQEAIASIIGCGIDLKGKPLALSHNLAHPHHHHNINFASLIDILMDDVGEVKGHFAQTPSMLSEVRERAGYPCLTLTHACWGSEAKSLSPEPEARKC